MINRVWPVEPLAYASRVLLIGHAFIAFSAIITYFSRRHQQLYPSSWFLIAALVAFPWIVGTAHWLLVETPTCVARRRFPWRTGR